MNPPLKLRHGDTLATLYDRFNSVIDYLARTRIVAGSGIRVSQLPAGQIVKSTATAAGGTAAAPAGGMFRVTEINGNIVKVSGGMITNDLRYVPIEVPAGTLNWNPSNSGHDYVLLVWPYQATPYFAISTTLNGEYVPGEKVCWPLAQLTFGFATQTFVQLWQGGMIDFSTRYYMS